MERMNAIFKKLNDLMIERNRLSWTLYTVGYDFGVEKNYEELIGELKNKESYEYLKELYSRVTDDVDKRRVEIIYNLFKPFHLREALNEMTLKIQQKENELAKILNTFRYTFEGKKVTSVELEQILATEEKRERRKEAYFAYAQINSVMVQAGFPELIRLRKEYAKMAGFDSYIDYRLDDAELDKNTFNGWIEDFHKALPEMNKLRSKYARLFLNDDVIMPWDESYIGGKLAPSTNKVVDMSNYYDVISELFIRFGINISKFNITYDIFPRTNKSEWGYFFEIETAKDTRILANVKNKLYEYSVLLHETGHAVHSYLLDPNEEILNMGVSGIVSEGIANLFQAYRLKPIFYRQFFSENENVDEEFNRLGEFYRISSLKALTNIFFEHSLYLNDINTLDDIYKVYWKNYENLYQVQPFSYEIPWANRIHYTTHPIYLQNYFMGDVLCEMLFKKFSQCTGRDPFVDLKEFGDFVYNEVIKPSGLYNFNRLFKNISGESFTLKYLLE